MSKKIMGISVCFVLIFTLMFTFNNCTPIHESGDFFTVPSLSTCDSVYTNFYKNEILSFKNIQSGSQTCGECHSDGGFGDPQFLDNFSNFMSLSIGETSIQEGFKTATNKVIFNANTGKGGYHAGGGLSDSEAGNIRSALQLADAEYDDCKLDEADTPL